MDLGSAAVSSSDRRVSVRAVRAILVSAILLAIPSSTPASEPTPAPEPATGATTSPIGPQRHPGESRGLARTAVPVRETPVQFLPSPTPSASTRPRARDLGISPGVLPPGALNAITDVAGVRVGQVTLIEGDRVRTGVTAILPHGGNLFQDKVPGAVFVGNAFGKLAGSTQVQELGTIETPIVLSNTLAVGTAVDAVVGWTLAQPANGDIRSVNALVGGDQRCRAERYPLAARAEGARACRH